MQSLSNKKQLRFAITLGTGSFGDGDQIILQGYRSSANIDLAGGLQMGQMRARIYGMKQSDMNAITTYAWRLGDFKPNTIVVYAIDGAQESIAYTGNIVTAWADYGGMPDVYLDIQSQSVMLEMLKAAPPLSVKGQVDVATLIGQLCTRMGFILENNGVDIIQSDPYLAGTDMEKVRKLVADNNLQMWELNNVIAIAPKGISRGGLIPFISPQTGLVGYPTFDGVSVNCRILFNPGVRQGGVIRIQSDAARASGDWQVLSMGHQLDAETPNGAWFTTIRAVPKNIVSPTP